MLRDGMGGGSYTHRPTTVVVYPSYGIGSSTGASMVVSYSLSQDALRFGAFAGGKGEGGEDVLLRSISMKDLADIHGVSEVLWGMKVDHKACNWYGSEYSAGELALRASEWLLL